MFKDNESYSIIKSILLSSKPKKQFLKAREESGVFLVTSNGMNLHFLNEIAGRFLSLCDGKVSVDNIIDEILLEYDVNRDVLESDILDLICDLQRKRLIYIDPLEIDYE